MTVINEFYRTTRPYIVISFVLIFSLLNSSCALQWLNDNTEIMAENSPVYLKGSPYDALQSKPLCNRDTIIKPDIRLSGHKRAGILFLPTMNDSGPVMAHLSDILHRELLKRKTFKIVEQIDQMPLNVNEAIDIGKNETFDYIIVCEILDLLEGDTFGSSIISLRIRLLDPYSRVTLLYIEDCEMSSSRSTFSVYSMLETNIPSFSLEKLSADLLSRMSRKIDKYIDD